MTRRIAEEDVVKAMLEREGPAACAFPRNAEAAAVPVPDMWRGKLASLQ